MEEQKVKPEEVYSQQVGEESIPSSALPEQTLFSLRKHIFGIFLIYAEATVAAIFTLIFIFFIAPSAFNGISKSSYGILAALSIMCLVVLMFILLVATYVYRESKLIITNKHVIQILQMGLFSRKVSSLSMSNVEDVSAEQKGILATIFNFGTLTVETAGEQENFVFPYCPNPNYYAQQILDARGQFIEVYLNDNKMRPRRVS